MRTHSILLLAAVACSDKGDDTGAPLGSDDPTNCALRPTMGEIAKVRPGSAVSLAVVVADPPSDLTVTWSASEGTIEDGDLALWTVPDDIGTHVDAEVTLTVTVGSSACLPETDEATVAVGWEETDRVVVLYNPTVEGSQDVADYYADARGIDASQVCGVESTEATTMAGADLSSWMETAQDCIDAVGERVHYVVPVWGVPYRVSDRIYDIGGGGSKATVSLDGLLVYGRAAKSWTSAIYNPLYQDGDSSSYTWDPYVPFGALREALSEDFGAYYLVTRIDGADADAAMDLVDRAMEGQALADDDALAGIVYVDGNRGDTPPTSDSFGSYESGEWNMWGTKQVFEDQGIYEVVWDGNSEEFGTEPAPTWCPDALFYAGWYSYYNYNDAFEWAPGAIGGHLDSCSACTVRDGGTWSAEALERGITATYGAVSEPYVAGMPEYDQLYLYLIQGGTYGEAAYESTVVGAWMMVFVGDPLYRPFPAGDGA